jgi:two-component system, cell cycle sensor histidine kinase and response regulator CckA
MPDEDVIDALRRSEERYRELFDSHPAAMAVWDPATGAVLAVNDAAVRQYGYSREEFVGLTLDRIVHPDDQSRLAEAVPRFSVGVDGAAGFRHLRKDGTEIEVEVTGHPITWDGRPARLVMATDVTERLQLEAQLRQAQKMEAVGRLAGGIAHDFNNLLTAITGYSGLLIESLDEGDPRRDDAEQIRTAAERATELTGQLLAFSRRGMVRPIAVDIHGVVQDMEPMLRRLIGEHIKLRTDLRADEPHVLTDRSQVEQVILNLVLNARDAMSDGGRLTIETEALEATAAWAQGLTPATSVVLTVADTGTGIADDVREHVFEPFFTTKGPTGGGGLGLATVYATVRQAGGRIRLQSVPGRGTTVRIVLPISPRPDDVLASEGAPVNAQGTPGRVLLVEDEAAVRELVERILRKAGFEVTAAPDPMVALRMAVDAGPFDLLVSDIVMPGMNGIELARELRASRPDLRVLLISGYTEEAVGRVGPDGLDLLAKPFTADELLGRVRRVLLAP